MLYSKDANFFKQNHVFCFFLINKIKVYSLKGFLILCCMLKGKVKTAKGRENCSVVFRELQVQNMKCVLFSSKALHLDSSICSANDCQNTKLCENGPFLARSMVLCHYLAVCVVSLFARV